MEEDAEENCSCPLYLLDQITIWCENYVGPLLGCLGVVSNLSAITILKSPKMKSTFHQSLIALSLCDLAILFFILVDIFVDIDNQIYIYLYPYVWHPLKSITMCWETYLTMSIATERLFAVLWPVLYRRHRLHCSSVSHLLTFILPGLIFAVLINIPRYFEIEFVCSNGRMDIQATSLRMNKTYIFIYIYWMRLLFTGIIPYLFLIFANVFIIHTLKKQSQQSEILRMNISGSNSLILKAARSNYLNITLSNLVLVHLASNLPRLILNLMEHSLKEKFYEVDRCGCYAASFWIPSLMRISHLCLIFNSSVNFFIYILFSSRFLKIFKEKFTSFICRLNKKNIFAQNFIKARNGW